MKTIRRKVASNEASGVDGFEYKRVSNEKADELVKKSGYTFTSKKSWKVNVRDIQPVKPVKEVVVVDSTPKVKVKNKDKKY